MCRMEGQQKLESEPRPLVRRMSTPILSSGAQLRYLLQWFSEFSELQREDFLPVLAAAQGDKQDQLASALAALNWSQDKPASLFQCRIKLFNDWYPTLSDDERARLVKGVTETDAEFGQKLQEYGLTNGDKVNGDTNGFYDVSPDDFENRNGEAATNEAVVEINGVEEVNEPAPSNDLVIEESNRDAEGDLENNVTDNIPIEIAAAS